MLVYTVENGADLYNLYRLYGRDCRFSNEALDYIVESMNDAFGDTPIEADPCGIDGQFTEYDTLEEAKADRPDLDEAEFMEISNGHYLVME